MATTGTGTTTIGIGIIVTGTGDVDRPAQALDLNLALSCTRPENREYFSLIREPFGQSRNKSEATRRKVYDMLVADKMRVQGFHYPFPSLAHVEKYGTGYREIPVIWNPAI
jgi:hypothetical protein